MILTLLGCTSSAPTAPLDTGDTSDTTTSCDTCLCDGCIDPNPDISFQPPDAVDAPWSDAVFDGRDCGGGPSECLEGGPSSAPSTLSTLMSGCKIGCATATLRISDFGCVAQLALENNGGGTVTVETERCLADAVAFRSWLGCGRFIVARLTACPK